MTWTTKTGLAILLGLLVACDNQPPAKAPKRPPLPLGENTLDRLLDQARAPAPRPAHLLAQPAALTFIAPSDNGTAHQQLRLQNDGGQPLTLGQIRVAGRQGDFNVSGDCANGRVLAQDGACVADIAFHATVAGRVEAELVIDQGAVGSSLFVPLSAEALPAVAAPAPTQARAVAALSFAHLRQSAALTVERGSDPTPVAPPRDQDYRDAGLPGVTSSFPVDRARVLTADRSIPAVLENTINSQLPGRAIAVVERPVFGADDRLVLIPAGSRVIGSYRSVGKYGLARLDIAWNRILRPDGVAINIMGDGTDVMGRSGLPGELDNRLAEKYGSALLVSIIGAGGTWALADSSTAVTSPVGGTTLVESGRTQAANRLGNDVDRLAQHMVEDTVDVRPVLTVPQGTRLQIIAADDIWLRDPTHLQPISPPKGGRAARLDGIRAVKDLLPELIELLAETPSLQKAAPQTAQALLQSDLLQRLKGDDAAASVIPPAAAGAKP